ncbi:hypothetical protein BDV30DRAFT_47230 [Aspergillus minisclerotigenes]|uniref:Uncharacterized protein n=1 Tax=Aspergillus minisclerotigenes TaxID=656917 RepID=A0A5N6JDZ2_9EURO|nr:hypothetical protein BDV30DRAFT_47230 [Aspergillus minisclerotigenes]
MAVLSHKPPSRTVVSTAYITITTSPPEPSSSLTNPQLSSVQGFILLCFLYLDFQRMTLFSSSSKSTLPKSGSDSHSHHHSSSSNRNFGGFVPTATLQVQTIGYDVDQALTGRTLENISVFRSGSRDAEYGSIRLKKNSNSCALVRVSDQATLMSTIYCFGPG